MPPWSPSPDGRLCCGRRRREPAACQTLYLLPCFSFVAFFLTAAKTTGASSLQGRIGVSRKKVTSMRPLRNAATPVRYPTGEADETGTSDLEAGLRLLVCESFEDVEPRRAPGRADCGQDAGQGGEHQQE